MIGMYMIILSIVTLIMHYFQEPIPGTAVPGSIYWWDIGVHAQSRMGVLQVGTGNPRQSVTSVSLHPLA